MPKRAREWGALDAKRASHSGKVSRNEWHAVGGVAGLLLQITPGDAKSWILRTVVGGARRSIGLGAYPEIGLAAARDKAREARAKIEAGVDPIEERKAARAALAAARRRNLTFSEATALWIGAKLSDRPEKSRKATLSALQRHAFPAIGAMLVQDIAAQDVVRALQPIWAEKPDTAVKLRAHIEAALTYATVAGHRSGDKPRAIRRALWLDFATRLDPDATMSAHAIYQAFFGFQGRFEDRGGDIQPASGDFGYQDIFWQLQRLPKTVSPVVRYPIFEFGGIVFENYRGAKIPSARGGALQSFIEKDDCNIFPVGVPGLFKTVYAPADLEEAVNTMGRRLYTRQAPWPNGKGRAIDSQMNALQYCSRPKVLMHGVRGAA